MSKETTVATILKDLDDKVVSPNGYSRGELSEAFDRIKDPKNWKMPIMKLIHKDEFDICDEACVFFTGSRLVPADSPDENGGVLVSAAGYYATIGA